MINILKQFEEWVTALKSDKFQVATLKLTFFYVCSTAVILLISSIAVLIIFSPPENKLQFSPETEYVEEQYDEFNTYELREHLSAVIFLVDLVVLLIVSMLSYYFARLTLKPIKDVDEQQRQFMSDIAHELRTPLSVMQVGAETILRRQRSADEYKDFVIDVQDETKRLTRLSNQLLRLLRIGKVDTQIFRDENVSELVLSEIRRFAPYAAEHNVMLTTNVPEHISSTIERDGFIEVVQNILKNAIDYNKENGSVSVDLSKTETEIVLRIKDTGVGIPKEKQLSAFDRFTKGDVSRTQTNGGGAGLGLSIVNALVKRLKGSVTLESVENVGTTVVVRVPIHHS